MLVVPGAWSPLGGGVLSGKYTQDVGTPNGARLPAVSITEREHAIARAVSAVAREIGASASQVALAWTMTRSRVVHAIVGVRRLEQLQDNLQALTLRLPPESVAQLEAATGFELGFPHDFIAGMRAFVFGDVADRVDQPRRPEAMILCGSARNNVRRNARCLGA